MLEVIELIGRLLHGFSVWRMAFSGTYRRKVLERWKVQGKAAVAFEIFELAIGFVLTVLVVYALILVTR
ncbi:MAG: hypothetical protein A3H27_19245 [Acidobacteria bacterium RIFCSPLOWO2_02_FULL_59_13]|nr:MAG: hypothetical protein A3H27_19245 [Acidobacteria bacterium RIFCSPLOWO2_02_FULL_59_13]